MSERKGTVLNQHRLPAPKTSQSKTLRLLREEPRTLDELPNGGTAINQGTDLRALTARLKAPTAGSGRTDGRGGATLVVFLYGDERRAVSKFIDVNESYVESCLHDRNDPLSRNWDDVLYQLLLEEWEFRQYEWKGGESDE